MPEQFKVDDETDLNVTVKLRYEANDDTNAFTDDEKSKLSGIEAGAQVNPGNATTGAAGLMSAADKTKLDGVESSADVTDATNVAAAGAVMDGDFSANGIMARTGAGAYASRTITAGTLVTVTNGNGQSGNPTVGLANVATETVIGRVAASTGAASALSKTELTTLINTFTTSLSGAVPAASGGNTTTQFLRKDGTWAVPAGAGGITEIVAGTGIAVDDTDPEAPIVSIDAGSGIDEKTTIVGADKLLGFDSANGDEAVYFEADTVRSGLAASLVEVNAQTGTSYTLVLGDASKAITMTNAAANTLNIPTNASVAFPVGTVLAVYQGGAGVTTIDAASGVTLNGVSGGAGAVSAQYSGCSLLKIATDTWLVAGGIGTVA